jgi:WD40-like Beta Propeller Repeat
MAENKRSSFLKGRRCGNWKTKFYEGGHRRNEVEGLQPIIRGSQPLLWPRAMGLERPGEVVGRSFFAPRWSPDGQYILGMPADSSGLMLFDFKSGKWSDLFKGLVEYPCWSRDSRYVYFLSLASADNEAIERMAMPSGKIDEVVSLKGAPRTGYYSDWLGLAPDDSPWS